LFQTAHLDLQNFLLGEGEVDFSLKQNVEVIGYVVNSEDVLAWQCLPIFNPTAYLH
jgi:hypothetical protein